jgi:hypothetical protein
MIRNRHCREERFRVWIVAYEGPRPADWRAAPGQAVAVEPAETGTMSARQAGLYVEAFNRSAAASQPPRWAVALPVTIRYEGDPQPGQPLGESRRPQEPALAGSATS